MKWSNLNTLKVALLDDHDLIRSGFRLRIKEERDLEVVAVFSSSREAMQGLKQIPVDVLVLDYSLQQDEMDGLNLIRLIRARFPKLRILVSSGTESPAIVSLALRAGCVGFVGKSQNSDELIKAIRVVADERIFVSEGLAYALDIPSQANNLETLTDLTASSTLSPKEKEVIRCCLAGMKVSEVSEKFNRSRKTISGQKQSAFRKLGIRSDAELFKIYGATGHEL